MLIAGVEKLTTLDYPGRLAAIVFTAGCNFRCGYCHNPQMVDPERMKETVKDLIPEEVFFNFLTKRKGMLDGVCITGGEPTLQPDLLEFVLKIKSLGFKVKIDTNGTMPGVLESLLENKAVDYFAMDIKTSLKRYEEVARFKLVKEEINRSKEIIQNCGLEYEFRTTVLKEIHPFEVFDEIGEWIKGAEKYYLQNFRSKSVLEKYFENYNGFSENELAEVRSVMEKYVKFCGIRT
ncbi:MAG: anaerobic ribonucleoside-triphosphate reductase activating protein [Candidatus Pacebacteria bacterium]|nr:anaerobic ribonucleoside-triphosphate reductase activating protein [Candidatus Paceibacterota bacterium]NUQ57167.1 anaerobic ribonucleoside-triphosphate reductase activating protein [Candidatus Paceibacter sp.]